MNVLITGGAGYIGSVIVEHCIKNNFNVHIVDDLSTGCKKLINPLSKFHKCDICNIKSLEKIFIKNKFDLIIHLAAKTRVGESVKYPELYYDVNVNGTLNILKLMKKYDCNKIIFSSSAAVYGVPKKIPINEDDNKSPCNPYGSNKLECEKHIINSNFTYGIMRFSNVSGASKTLKYGMIQKQPSLLIPIVNRLLLKNKKPIIFGNQYKTKDGTCLRDYVHVEDIANTCDLLVKKILSNESLIINVCSNEGHSVMDVIKKTCLINKKAFEYVIKDIRPGDPDKLILDNTRMKKKLNYVPKYSLNKMIESDLKFILNNKFLIK